MGSSHTWGDLIWRGETAAVNALKVHCAERHGLLLGCRAISNWPRQVLCLCLGRCQLWSSSLHHAKLLSLLRTTCIQCHDLSSSSCRRAFQLVEHPSNTQWLSISRSKNPCLCLQQQVVYLSAASMSLCPQAFDELLLLQRGGYTLYCGEMGKESRSLIDYFQGLGADKIAAGYNPATWVLEQTTASKEEKLGVNFAEAFQQSDVAK